MTHKMGLLSSDNKVYRLITVSTIVGTLFACVTVDDYFHRTMDHVTRAHLARIVCHCACPWVMLWKQCPPVSTYPRNSAHASTCEVKNVSPNSDVRRDSETFYSEN
jgi:hypothetical protein